MGVKRPGRRRRLQGLLKIRGGETPYFAAETRRVAEEGFYLHQFQGGDRIVFGC